MMSNRFLPTVVLALALGSASAIAADKVTTVHFKAGSAHATLRGKIKGWDTMTYRLGASEGQVMSVLLSPNNRSCYFNVMPPSGEEAIFIGADRGNEFADQLHFSGDYKVEVYLMRNEARRGKTCAYTITFEISG